MIEFSYFSEGMYYDLCSWILLSFFYAVAEKRYSLLIVKKINIAQTANLKSQINMLSKITLKFKK